MILEHRKGILVCQVTSGDGNDVCLLKNWEITEGGC